MDIEVISGVCSKQGIRSKMEDFYLIQNEYNVEKSRCTSGIHSLYAIFDGHNGHQCAKYCSEQIPHILHHQMQISTDIRDAFEATLNQLDTEILNHTSKTKMKHSGSCLNLVLIDLKTNDLWCINVGDSRCILLRNNFTSVTQLSTDHKPNHPTEHQRIINSWLTPNLRGWVSGGRICGILGVSRALGDFDSKEYDPNLLICKPDIIHHKINTQGIYEYIVIACDGLYDVMNNERIMKYCSHLQKTIETCTDITHNNNTPENNKSLNFCSQFAEKLVAHALGRRSKDNVSVIIVRISPMITPMTPFSDEQQITPGEDIQLSGAMVDDITDEGKEGVVLPQINSMSMTHSMTQSITMSYDESLELSINSLTTDDEQSHHSWKSTKIRNTSVVCQKKGRFSVYSEEFWTPPNVSNVNNNNSGDGGGHV